MTEASGAYDLPRSLREYPQWVVWKNVQRDGQRSSTKVLYTPAPPPTPLVPASSTDPDTWSSYKMAKIICERRTDVDGIGFVFTAEDPFVGIDLDTVYDYEITPEGPTKVLQGWAAEIVQAVNSYTEASPSGEGIHIIARAKLPGRGRKKGSHDTGEIGMYDQGRFFTFTGQPADAVEIPTQAEPQDRQRQVETLYRAMWPEKPKPSKAVKDHLVPDASLTDDEIITKLNAEPSGKAHALWHGDTSEYDSHSEADLALCSKIAFYTGPDSAERIEELFSLSALGKRGKWLDRDRYRQDTIEKALEGIDAFYSPPQAPLPRPSTRGRGDRPDSKDSKTVGTQQTPTRAASVSRPAAPFPIDAMPSSCSTLITEGVAALGCAPELIAIPMLSALSGAIGTSRVAQVKRSWKEFPALFLSVVASPGSMKSPAAKIALAPVYAQQDAYKLAYFTKKASYEEDLRKWEVEKKMAQKDNKPAPAPPEPPAMFRTIASDTTVEALVAILEENPRGINLHRDELSGWVRGMDQYKSGGKGADRQHWLSIWDSQPMVVDRKARVGEPIILSRPFVSLFGGIQPSTLGELGGTMEDGLMDRFLFAYPATRHIRYSHAEIAKQTENRYDTLYDSLIKLKPGEDNGRFSPKPLEFTFEAKRIFAEQVDGIGEEVISPGFPSRLEGVWAKMKGYLARLSLIMACARYAELKPSEREQTQEEIQKADIEKAVALLEYFKEHAKRVYSVLQEADPLDLFSADLKGFLESQEENTWTGPATELYEALEDEGIENLPPDPARLTRLIQEVSHQSPSLHIQRKRGDQGKRRIKVWLEHPQSENTPTS